MNDLYKYYFRPRFSDMDSYGIAHHSRYLCWFEEARIEYLGCYYQDLDFSGKRFKMPVTRVEVKYIRSVTNTENMVVKLDINYREDIPLLHLDYQLMDSKETRLYAKAYTEHIIISENGDIVNQIPEELLSILRTIKKGVNVMGEN